MTYTGNLTNEHLELIASTRDEFMQNALRTDRCDRPAAEAAVRKAYQAAGIDEPEIVIWMDSPLGGAFASALMRNYLGKKDQIMDGLPGWLWYQLRGELGVERFEQLRGELWGQLAGHLKELARELEENTIGQLRDHPFEINGYIKGQPRGLRQQLLRELKDRLGDFWPQITYQLDGRFRQQLWNQLGDLDVLIRAYLCEQLGVQLNSWGDAYWLAFHRCALAVAGMPKSNRLEALIAATMECGWWWPMDGAVVISDRPTAIRQDAEFRLHSDDGPALTWADGFRLDAWHGTRVPSEFWDWSVERALAESNVEVRRCAIERIGWENLIDRLTEVSACDDPGNPGQVLRLFDLPEVLAETYEQPARLLLCANASLDKGGHRRRFGLIVPAHHDDPINAAADLFGVAPAAYRSLGRAS